MEDGIPKIHLQPPSVDFIDNQLPGYHDAFRNLQARFDTAAQRYVPTSDGDNGENTAIASVSPLNSAPAPLLRRQNCYSDTSDEDNTSDDSDNGGENSLAPRPLPAQAVAMKFWGFLFDDALETFKRRHEQPKERPEIYDIRRTTNWEAVYARLQLARKAYDGTKGDFGDRPKRMRRKIGDYAGTLRGLAKFIPDGTYTSPVRAAVEVLLDVCPQPTISRFC